MDLNQIKQRVDAAQQERPWLAFPVAVVKKFGEDKSGNLAVVITYYAFFSIFPLLLALTSILGFVLAGHPDWQHAIERSAFKNFPLVKGGKLPHSGSVLLIVVGIGLAVYSGLGVAKAAQSSFDTVYGVQRDEEPGFLAKNLGALRLVVVGGVGLIVTTALTGLVTGGETIGIPVGWGLTIIGIIVSAVLNTGLLILVFRWLTVRTLTVREVLAGAAFAAFTFAVLQSLATAFIDHKLSGARATYGRFGAVIVLLSWFYLQAQVLLLAAQVNVVKQDRLWPRSLAED